MCTKQPEPAQDGGIDPESVRKCRRPCSAGDPHPRNGRAALYLNHRRMEGSKAGGGRAFKAHRRALHACDSTKFEYRTSAFSDMVIWTPQR